MADRHYYGQIIKKDGWIKVLDTLDLKTEIVQFKTIAPLFTEKFINAFSATENITKKYNKNPKKIDEYINDAFPPYWSISCDSKFEFPIQSGYISYDRHRVRIVFRGEEYYLRFVPMHNKRRYLVFGDKILSIEERQEFKNAFYIQTMEFRYGVLHLKLGLKDADVFVNISIDYKTDKVTAEKALGIYSRNEKEHNGIDKFTRPTVIDEHLREVITFIENRMFLNISINGYAMPEYMEGIIEESYKFPSTKKETIRLLFTLYSVAETSGKMYQETCILKEGYERFMGEPFKPDLLVAKYHFLRRGAE